MLKKAIVHISSINTIIYTLSISTLYALVYIKRFFNELCVLAAISLSGSGSQRLHDFTSALPAFTEFLVQSKHAFSCNVWR